MRGPAAPPATPTWYRASRLLAPPREASFLAAALETELAPLHEAAFCWALRCCDGDRDAAAETVQSTYLKILDGRARFGGRSSLKTWLFAVVRRTAGEQRRRTRLRRLGLALLAARGGAAARPPSPEADAEAAGLRAALGRLSRRQREILHLVFYEDLTIEEAAAVAGISLGSARTHYARGKQALRRLLAGEERP